ncbi:co-chaperone YbbN [Nocardia sp. CS682]|uniref:thioredoxin family protein n=1 Tax=Nocardia sp. CS682 TaxID=1047172 RepID=UPI0010751302|nr:thiol reductase thioredoxin [Nocardia sp. CS682]
MSGTLKDVTDASFEREIERSDRPVLVLFWAAWDGWAEYQAVLGEVVAGYGGKVDGCRITADEHADTAGKCGVRALPRWFCSTREWGWRRSPVCGRRSS